MSEQGLNLKLNSTWKTQPIPRGKQIARHNKTAFKTTVSLYLNRNLVEKARKQGLNLSRICEEALNSILTYMEAQNNETPQTESSKFLNRGSFQKETRAGSSVWYERLTCTQEVGGSNPPRSTGTNPGTLGMFLYYLCFLKILVPLKSQTYSNPASTSVHASFSECATLAVNSSSSELTSCV